MGQQNLTVKLITRLKKKQSLRSFQTTNESTQGQKLQVDERESNLNQQKTTKRRNVEVWRQPLQTFRKKQMIQFHQHSRSAVLDAFTVPSSAFIAAKTSASEEALRPAKIS